MSKLFKTPKNKTRKTPVDKLTIKEVLLASRPFSWINTGGPFAVGLYLALRGTDISGLYLPIGVTLFYFFFPYNLLVYGVNDIYDYESDINNPRKGGIEGGIMPKYKHKTLWYWILAVNVPLLLFMLFVSGRVVANVWLFGVVFMAAAYSIKDLRFKEVPFLDSFTSSWHFWSPLVYGLLLGANPIKFAAPAVAAFVLWGMASQSMGAIQDIKYDRDAGIGSIAATLGAKATGVYSTIAYLFAAMIPAIFYGVAGACASVILLSYVFNISRCLTSGADPAGYRKAWKAFMKLNLLAGFGMTIILLLVFRPVHLPF